MYILQALLRTLPFLLLTTATSTCPPHLQKRGAALSCFKPARGPSSSPPDGGNPQSAWPRPAAFEFTCEKPGVKAQYESDCYCNPEREIKCDIRSRQILQTMAESRLSRTRAVHLESIRLRELEAKARKMCKCGRPLERPFNPYTDLIVGRHLQRPAIA